MAELPSSLYGLLLTGGESRRMGRDKALLSVGDETQLDRSMRLLQTCTAEQFVSVRQLQPESARDRYATIVDRVSGIGPVAGILSAMRTHPDADWLVLACDLPRLDVGTLAYLVANRSAGKPFTAYASSHDGLPEPLCAIYRDVSRSIVEDFVDQGVHCPRKILLRSDTKILEQPQAGALDNMNTPHDLAQLRAVPMS